MKGTLSQNACDPASHPPLEDGPAGHGEVWGSREWPRNASPFQNFWKSDWPLQQG